MGTLEIIVLSVIVVILVFVLTVFQINKSYAYKHSVDLRGRQIVEKKEMANKS